MSNQILVPSLGESVTEATVSKWLKQVGEEVASDEPLVELETDKVNVEVPSPLEGILSSIKTEVGSVVKVGAILGETGMNIDEMVIGHGDTDGVAMMVIKTGAAPSADVLKALEAMDGIGKVASAEVN